MFEGLRKEYELGDIAACVKLLLERGARAGKTGYQPCHSPLAYLSKAITEVLRDVHRKRNAGASEAKRLADQRESEAEECVQRESSAREFSSVEAAFQKEFATHELQEQVIAEICRHMPFSTAPRLRRLYAVQKWYELQHSSAQPLSEMRGIK